MTKHESPSRIAAPSSHLGPVETLPNPWLGLNRTSDFFENDEISSLLKRGLFYARAGVPVHFQGTAGRGKTSLALEIANRLGRKVAVMTGHDWLAADDLIGREVGQTESSVVDKYIQRVRRSETQLRYDWEDSVLVRAMREGQTLIYDEFTRSSPQANGILLSVLEEGVLVFTNRLASQEMITAHPDFRIILTSNPDDYAGVNASPDALLDRMVTFNLSGYSDETEAGIVAARTGVSQMYAQRIVRLVHAFAPPKQGQNAGSMRAAIMIAQITAMRLRTSSLSDALLSQISADVLNGRGANLSTGQIAKYLTQSGSAKSEDNP